MKSVILLAIAFAFVGCTNKDTKPIEVIGCAVESAVVSASAAIVADQLACTGIDAIKVDLQKIVAKANLCKPADPAPVAAQGAELKSVPPAKSAVGDLLCAPVVEGLVAAATNQIPEAWKCTGGGQAEKLKAALLDACKKNL